AMSEVYEGKEDYYSDLAYHYEMAEEIEDARKFLRLSAEYSQRNFKNADALEKFERLLKYNKTPTEKVMLQNQIVQIHTLLGDYKKALELSESNRKLAEKTRDTDIILSAVLEWSKVMLFFQKYSEVREVLAGYLKKSIRDSRSLFDVYITISNSYYYSGLLNEANEYAEKGLKIALENGLNKDTTRAYGMLGIINMFIGKYPESLGYLKKQKEIAERSDNLRQSTNATANIGNIFYHMSKFQEAMDRYYEFLKEAQRMGDRLLIGMAYGNIANIHFIHGEHEEALELYRKQLDISLEMGDKTTLTNVYSNIGSVYQLTGKYEKAIEWMKKVREISEKSENILGIINSHFRIGMIYSEMEKHSKAIHEFKLSEKHIRNSQSSTLLASVCMNLAENLIFLGRFKEAERYLKEGYETAVITGEKLNICNYHEISGLLLSELERDKEAIEEYKQAVKIGNEVKEIKKVMLSQFLISISLIKLKDHKGAREYLEMSRKNAEILGNEVSLQHIEFYDMKLRSIKENDFDHKEVIKFLRTTSVVKLKIESCILLFELTADRSYVKKGLDHCDKELKR
ncbi:MAG: tetratricopeptide repeat protein, partial [Alphaproteobacteria bacterium]|nr:tetratricopeptide repeat protein [Alphaproteobacteria bacterium]